MAVQDALASPPHPAFGEPIKLVCFALCIANAAILVAMFTQGLWLVQPDGGGVPTDFANVWAAARLMLDGHPAGAYDWTLHKQVEELGLGHAFEGYYAWYYPPFFLAVVAPLALLPYAAASATWSLLTFPAYLAAIRAIVRERIALVLACAFPALVANIVVGQNGFLTAGLLGGALAAMPRRPVLAGCLLGLMTYKPQFGILVPLVLIAGREWRAFFTAAAVALALAAASLLAFGLEPWLGFLHNLQMANTTVMSHGDADLAKLQSLFGLARSLGAGERLAWTLQSGLSLATAATLWLVWRGRRDFDIKAAAVAVGALLATPYLYMYDLVVLAVPMAFLIRLGRKDSFLPHEWPALAFASLLVLSFPLAKAPVGFAAVVIVAALVARRAFTADTTAAAAERPSPAH